MSNTLIKVENVSKKFCRNLKKSLWYGMKDLGSELLGRRHGGKDELRPEEFWAVNDVSFELRRGECLGLIGRNGAGKTTLLRMLNGLIKPDKGRIEMRGRVGALIALGAGFNPILTGRENIYVNAAVLGLSKKKTDEKFDEIVEFAELGEFIDAPVQSYSSGMQVRLGFAVASSLHPDILILDEVLAVGDATFRYKCYRRIDYVRKNAAVIFVSHDMPSISRICSKSFVMVNGACEFIGDTNYAIDLYSRLSEEGLCEEAGTLEIFAPLSRFDVGALPEQVRYDAPITIELTIISEKNIGRAVIRVNVFNMSGAYVASCVIEPEGQAGILKYGTTRWRFKIACLPLKLGRYHLSFGLSGPDGGLLAISNKRHLILVAGAHPGAVAECQLLLNSVERL